MSHSDFSQYRRIAHYNVTHRRRQNFYALPTSQWQMLAAPPFDLLATLERVDDAIDVNAEIADAIVHSGLESFGLEAEPQDPTTEWRNTATAPDLDKARSTIRQMYRDWSEEGQKERRSSYDPVIEAVEHHFADQDDRGAVKILIPGAGLGRLVFDLCMRGYTVEGNEISYHQLLASNWILNHTEMFRQYDLYPFALEFSNVASREHQLKSVRIPDAHAGSELQIPQSKTRSEVSERMSMTAADFVVLYRDPARRATYDAVTTVFFVDTAPNVMRYIEAVRNCLKDGGIWINNGPLLWHFAERAPRPTSGDDGLHDRKDHVAKGGIEEPGSVELSNEELLRLVEMMGFQLEDSRIITSGHGYISNPDSMLQSTYRPAFWIARKKASSQP